MTLKRADGSDARFLSQALRALHGKPSVDLNAAQAFLSDPSCISYLAVGEGQVVGSLYGYALRRPETTRPNFFLYEIDVLESYRRQGIGRALVSAFVQEAKQKQALGAWVQAKSLDAGAIAFYQACGARMEEDGDALFHFGVE